MFPVKRLLREALSPRRVALIALGMAITTFGLFNIHRRVDVTEGGVLGMVLLLDHHFGIPPWLLTAVLDTACYFLGWRALGTKFLIRSGVATLCSSAFFRLWEFTGPILPDLSAQPLLAALLGGCFVGVGVGLVVRQGGSSGGDDALALVIAKKTKWRLSRAYLFTDLTVLALSLTYIAPLRIVWSLVTVTVSSLLIDFVKSAGHSEKRQNA